MSKTNFKSANISDLMKDLESKRAELRKIRFHVAGTAGLKNNHKQLRRDIARIMTELRGRNSQK